MSILDRARALRSIIEQISQSLDDNTALKAIELHPNWIAGIEYDENFKVRYGGKLYRVRQAHTSQSDWTPDIAVTLFAEINETHAGTLDDPIPYNGNMKLETDKCYLQDGVVYICTRDIEATHALKDLVGHFVEIVE